MDQWFNMAENEIKETPEKIEKVESKYCFRYPNCTRQDCKFLHEKDPKKKEITVYKIEGIEIPHNKLKNIFNNIWMRGAIAGQTRDMDINKAFKEYLKTISKN